MTEEQLKDIFRKEAEKQIAGHISHNNTCSTAMEIALITGRDSEKTLGIGDVKTINEIVEKERGIIITNPYSNLPPISYPLQSLSKKRNSNYTKPKKKRKKK